MSISDIISFLESWSLGKILAIAIIAMMFIFRVTMQSLMIILVLLHWFVTWFVIFSWVKNTKSYWSTNTSNHSKEKSNNINDDSDIIERTTYKFFMILVALYILTGNKILATGLHYVGFPFKGKARTKVLQNHCILLLFCVEPCVICSLSQNLHENTHK